ncbi:methyltransferase domain-containing protein [Halobacillus andaensis]|uniref:class I SAM-dependent DNA methyltransferase n=1 Tax=Halobacillus andaensis TaxID=1176239 RepID=UPI003D70BA22
MSYRRMAEVYDRLMMDAPYEDWVYWTKHMIMKFHGDASTILDLGCGTGEITIRLSQDYKMTGVDLSEDMLAIASNKDKHQQVQWLRQDISDLNGLSDFECVISYCDVMNYIVEERGLASVFQRAYQALQKNGLFMFDVHSSDHVNCNLLGQTFAEVYEDLSYIWFCDRGKEEDVIEHDLTFFIKNGDLFERFDETHYQKRYSERFLNDELKKTGFTILGVFADFSLTEKDEGERIFFVCQKI